MSLNALHLVDAAPRMPGHGFAGQRLTIADRTMRVVDLGVRCLGCPGFETQTLVWLASRADRDRLRAALAALGRRHPVAVARLVEELPGQGPFWQLQPMATCTLLETDLPAGSPEAVLSHAACLLAGSSDPTA